MTTKEAVVRWIVAGVLLVTACARTSPTRVSESEAAVAARTAPAVDHHQHLFGPATVQLARDPEQEPITAAKRVAMLDEAGIAAR